MVNFQDEINFDSHLFQTLPKIETAEDEAPTHITGTFDFSGFADFDSFNDATEPFNDETVTQDFSVSDFADFDLNK